MQNINSLKIILGGKDMKVLKKGKYKVRNWSLQVECTGESWNQKGKKPCHSILKLEDGDIVKREGSCTFEGDFIAYGFICPECKCFTEIDETKIPKEIKKYCPQVAAKGSDAYEKLTAKEKALSEDL